MHHRARKCPIQTLVLIDTFVDTIQRNELQPTPSPSVVDEREKAFNERGRIVFRIRFTDGKRIQPSASYRHWRRNGVVRSRAGETCNGRLTWSSAIPSRLDSSTAP